jgi:hypothetical protein
MSGESVVVKSVPTRFGVIWTARIGGREAKGATQREALENLKLKLDIEASLSR